MNGTGRTSRKHKSKGRQQHTGGKLSKKQQAILNAPVKLGEEVLVTIHGIGSSGEGVGRVDDFTVFVPFAFAWRNGKSIYQHGEKDICYR